MNNYPTRNGVDQAEPLDFTERSITLSTTITYRGRQITITASGYTLAAFADLLDQRAPLDTSTTAPQPLSAPPLCPVHRKAMRPMKYPGKRGEQWMCSAKEGDSWCEERA